MGTATTPNEAAGAVKGRQGGAEAHAHPAAPHPAAAAAAHPTCTIRALLGQLLGDGDGDDGGGAAVGSVLQSLAQVRLQLVPRGLSRRWRHARVNVWAP